jgi:magnesium-protoporphyrin O-methyltransferase
MPCPSCAEITGRHFDESMARRDLDRFHKKGPDKPTRILLDLIRRLGLSHATLLDVGGGIGVIHHELLDGTIERVVHVEASLAYLATARTEAQARGHDGRVEFVAGDAVALAPILATADVVTMDRVICCYPDAPALIAATVSKAQRFYAVSYPRDRLPVRLVVGLMNLVRRLSGSAFRVYVHPETLIERLVRAAGLEPTAHDGTLVWRVVVYGRK